MYLFLRPLAEVFVPLGNRLVGDLGKQESTNRDDASMFAVVHRGQGCTIFLRNILGANKFVSLAQLAVHVLIVEITVDFSTNPTVFKAFGGRWCIQT